MTKYDYVILSSADREELAAEIIEHLEKGYKLVGGVATSRDSAGTTYFYHSMLLEEVTE